MEVSSSAEIRKCSQRIRIPSLRGFFEHTKARPCVADTGKDHHFVKDESMLRPSGLFSLNWRMFRSFPVFLMLLPLSIATIIASSTAPLLFRWYSGQLSAGAADFTLNELIPIAALAAILRIAA